MDADLGRPIASLALENGTPVYDRSGERVGVVDGILGDENVDIFDGVIVEQHALGRPHFADVDQIAELRERGVVLGVDGDQLHELRERTGGEADDPLEERLRAAWERLRGRA